MLITASPPVTGKNTSPENNQNIPQIPPASIVKSQNDDARKVTRKEAVLLVQGEPTSLQPPQLPGDSKTIFNYKQILEKHSHKLLSWRT